MLLQFSKITKHIIRHRLEYLLILLLFLAGFLVGCANSNLISQTEFSDSRETAEEFIRLAKEKTLDWRLLFSEEIRHFFSVLILSFFLFGLPVIWFLIFKAGFSLGFFLAFLVKAFSLKGFFLGSFFLFCYLVFVLPPFLVVSRRALSLNRFLIASVLLCYLWNDSVLLF